MQNLRPILDSSPVGLAIVSHRTNKRLFVNEHMLEMFGVSTREELLEQDISETWVDIELLAQLREQAVRGEAIVDLEAERIRTDGSKWWVLMNSQMIDFEGEPARAIWHVDITRRKEAEEQVLKLNAELEQRVERQTQELRSNEAILKAFINHCPAKVHMKDEKGRITFINKRSEEIFAFPEKDIIGKTAHDIYPRDIADEFSAHDRLVMEKGQPVEKEEVFHIEGEDRTFSATKFPIYNDGRLTGIGSIAMDITERLKAEQELHSALVDAEMANHSKSEFLATMSHELRTPLNAILGFSDLLRGQYFGPLGENRYMEYASDIYSSGEHLLALISDILDISAIEAGKRPLFKEAIDLGVLMKDCVNVVFHAALEADIELVIDAPEDLPTINADIRALKQVLINLLSNAVKYSGKGKQVVLSARVDGDAMVIQVADTGQGISANLLPTITEPFTRGDSDAHLTKEGTGLGLAIVDLMVTAHDGKLVFESEEAKGTVVTVLLPIHKEASENTRLAADL